MRGLTCAPGLPTYAYVLIALGGGAVLLALLLTLLHKRSEAKKEGGGIEAATWRAVIGGRNG